VNKLIHGILVLSTACAPLVAQIHNVSENRDQTSQGWIDLIQNSAEVSIVAMHAYFNCDGQGERPKAAIHIDLDVLVHYGHDKPIPPGGSYSAHLPAWVSDCPGGVDSIIYADGKSEGDPQAVAQLYEQRRGAKSAIAYALPLLGNTAIGDREPIEAINQLKAHSREVAMDQTLSVDQRRAQVFVFSVIATSLQSQTEFLIPSDKTSYHQPHVDEVAKKMNIDRSRAHAIVLSKKLVEWQADLLGNGSIPQQ
jgi:hypothetical protein